MTSQYYAQINDWIGHIPNNWNLIKGKYLFYAKKEINLKNQCKNLLSLTLFGVLNKDINSSEGLRPDTYTTYQIFEKNDLVFKLIDLENVKTSRVGFVHERGIMSPVYLRLEPIQNKIHPKFTYWFYFDLYNKEIYNAIGSGVRSALSSSDLLELKIPVPPLHEQISISEYLNKKTIGIDSLIKKTQQKIKVLEEKRSLLINEYTTKGLDQKVKMKDSEIEWIGKIPNHWKISRLKYVLTPFVERSSTGNEELLSVTIKKGVVRRKDYLDKDEKNQTRAETLKGYKHVKKDNLINNIMKMGFRCLGISPYDGIVSPAYSVFEVNQSKVNVGYLHTILRSDKYVAEYRKKSKGIQETRMRLYDDYFVDFPILIPPILEQKKIFEKIHQVDKHTNLLIEKEIKYVELIKEYRKSLISDLVTGKINIHNEVIR